MMEIFLCSQSDSFFFKRFVAKCRTLWAPSAPESVAPLAVSVACAAIPLAADRLLSLCANAPGGSEICEPCIFTTKTKYFIFVVDKARQKDSRIFAFFLPFSALLSGLDFQSGGQKTPWGGKSDGGVRG